MQGRTAPKLWWLCVLSLCYYAAVTIGDNVAQSVFVSRMGVGALPNIFLLKAGIDVLSGLLYLPLTQGRSPRLVWRILLGFYAVVVAAGWWASAGTGSDTGAYLLYAGHEVAWTLAVIHWGIFLLDIVTPQESRMQHTRYLHIVDKQGPSRQDLWVFSSCHASTNIFRCHISLLVGNTFRGKTHRQACCLAIRVSHLRSSSSRQRV